MKKIKNYGFWTALSGALVLFIGTLGEAFGFHVKQELISNIVMAFAELLVVLGIVIMPKKKDDEKEESSKEVEEISEENQESEEPKPLDNENHDETKKED